MRSQNRKVKSARLGSTPLGGLARSMGGCVGKTSCLGLLVLGLTLVNPVGLSGVVFAEEELVEEIELEGAEDEAALAEEVNYDDQIMLTSSTPSTVGISFSPTSGSATLSPTTSAGQSAQINILATVSVKDSGGYSVYLKGSSINLVGKKSTANIIPSATTAKTYANMDVNTWGYAAKEGTAIPEGATYKAISVSGNGDKIAENTNYKIASDTKNIMLSFAAKINDTKPADIYQNTLTLSVVSSPLRTTLVDITNMQEMTNDICDASAVYETKQLKDTRDGKYYWTTKLADKKCWMTQNLDLDLSTSVALTPSTSDVTANWTPGFSTATAANSSSVNTGSQTETRSWSLGDYRITNPTIGSDCGVLKNSAANCPSQFTYYVTPTTANKDELAHYSLGNHYQWNAATAGTGSSTATTGQASASVCPQGWRLPTTNNTTIGSFGGLTTASNITVGDTTGDIVKLTSAPYYFVMGGGVSMGSNLYYFNAGNDGRYWSSTPSSSNTSYANYLILIGTEGKVGTSYHFWRNYGYSVRCIAR